MQMNKLIAVSAAALMLSSVCISCTSKKEKGSSSESAAEITTVKEETDPVGKERVDINDYITSGTPAPALWRAYDPETGNELYLMGTIHVVSEDTFPLPDYIMEAYDKCDGIAVEYDINTLQSDFSLMQEYLMGMVYTDGTTIKDHISEETYEKAKACLKDMGFYNSLLDSYMPGFWLSQIEASALLDIDNMTSEGVDSTFISYAENDGKEVVSIETLQIQTQAVTGFSDELADYMLSETVDEYGSADELAEEFAQQYNSWASGDIDALATLYTHHWCNYVPTLEDKLLAGRQCVLIQLVRSQFVIVAEQADAVVGVCMGGINHDGKAPVVELWKDDYERTFAAATERAKTADPALEGSLFGDWRELQKADRFIASGSPYGESELNLFMVEPWLKGQGVGHAMFEQMRALLREGGATRFFLMTDTASDFEYYERHGMHLIERYPDDPDDPDCWAALMYGGDL